MRRALFISPHFPPINAADHQRVRMSFPYLEECGWQAEVLAVRPEDVEGVRDDVLLETVPPSVRVHFVSVPPPSLTRKIGLGSLALRAYRPFRVEGDRLLSTGRFDLVYFSTTMFTEMHLGVRWKKKYGVPYVLDFQDPWRSDYYDRTGARPPGGRLKYAVAQGIARTLEPATVRAADQIISVSPKYPQMLRERYPGLREDIFTVLPFGAPEADFDVLDRAGVRQDVFDPADGLKHFVYVGRGGPDMARALRILFRAVAMLRAEQPALAGRLRFHFVGTSYARAGHGEPTILPIAQECGVAELVQERTDRVGYFQALRLLRDADVISLIGSDDAMYTASKLYPCVLARRPILGVFHEESSVVGILKACRAGEVVPFRAQGGDEQATALMRETLARFLSLDRAAVPETDWEAFRPYTAREMTRQQCAVFDAALAGAPTSTARPGTH